MFNSDPDPNLLMTSILVEEYGDYIKEAIPYVPKQGLTQNTNQPIWLKEKP